LIEVLVVVLVVATFCAVIFPSFKGYLQAGTSGACASNLRQIGTAVHLYMAEHNGEFPPSRGRDYANASGSRTAGPQIYEALADYIPNPDKALQQPSATHKTAGVYWCPGDTSPTMRPVRWSHRSYGFNAIPGGGYSIQTTWDGQPNPTYMAETSRAAACSNASQVIYAMDHVYPTSTTLQNEINIYDWPLKKGSGPEPTSSDLGRVDFSRHGNRVNALFLDGSVRSMTFSDLCGTERKYCWPLPP